MVMVVVVVMVVGVVLVGVATGVARGRVQRSAHRLLLLERAPTAGNRVEHGPRWTDPKSSSISIDLSVMATLFLCNQWIFIRFFSFFPLAISKHNLASIQQTQERKRRKKKT